MQERYTVATLLKRAAQELSAVSDSPMLDAELLLIETLNRSRVALRAWPDDVISNAQLESFQILLRRRAHGEPIAYIIGRREFWSLLLKVTPDTLIPRPETELLVDQAISVASNFSHPLILDAGTGTGAIAIALQRELPTAYIVATDLSWEALKVAKDNAQIHNTNIMFARTRWLNVFRDQCFDIIVSNPPYIDENDPHLHRGDVRFEPTTALVSGENGMFDIRQIIEDGRRVLKSGGYLILEHGWQQGSAVRNYFSKNAYSDVSTINDLGGNERITYAKR